MSLNLDEQLWLERLFEFACINDKRMSNWERGFINDHRERYESEGAEMRVSPKQRGWLIRIEDKIGI